MPEMNTYDQNDEIALMSPSGPDPTARDIAEEDIPADAALTAGARDADAVGPGAADSDSSYVEEQTVNSRDKQELPATDGLPTGISRVLESPVSSTNFGAGIMDTPVSSTNFGAGIMDTAVSDAEWDAADYAPTSVAGVSPLNPKAAGPMNGRDMWDDPDEAWENADYAPMSVAGVGPLNPGAAEPANSRDMWEDPEIAWENADDAPTSVAGVGTYGRSVNTGDPDSMWDDPNEAWDNADYAPMSVAGVGPLNPDAPAEVAVSWDDFGSTPSVAESTAGAQTDVPTLAESEAAVPERTAQDAVDSLIAQGILSEEDLEDDYVKANMPDLAERRESTADIAAARESAEAPAAPAMAAAPTAPSRSAATQRDQAETPEATETQEAGQMIWSGAGGNAAYQANMANPESRRALDIQTGANPDDPDQLINGRMIGGSSREEREAAFYKEQENMTRSAPVPIPKFGASGIMVPGPDYSKKSAPAKKTAEAGGSSKAAAMKPTAATDGGGKNYQAAKAGAAASGGGGTSGGGGVETASDVIEAGSGASGNLAGKKLKLVGTADLNINGIPAGEMEINLEGTGDI